MSRVLIAVVLCLIAAAPGNAQVTRVSVSTAGVEANGQSFAPSISANGRFVVFTSRATNLVPGDTNAADDVFLRDRDTDADGVFDEAGAVSTTRISVATAGAQLDDDSFDPAITPDGRFVAFKSTASNLLPGSPAGRTQLYRIDRTTSAVVRVSENAAGGAADGSSTLLAISADGNIVAFASEASNLETQPFVGEAIYLRDIASDLTSRVPIALQPSVPGATTTYARLALSADGNRLVYIARETVGATLTRLEAFAYDRTTAATTPIPTAPYAPYEIGVSASGALAIVMTSESVVRRRVIDTGAETAPLPLTMVSGTLAVSPSGRYALAFDGRLADFDLSTSTPLAISVGGGAFSPDDRWLAIWSSNAALVPGDANATGDAFVIDLPDLLDADDDTMDDRWETLFNVTDPNADPDGDGQTNAQEENAGTHPNGQVRRFLAEGATGAFFHTAIALANPGAGQAATVLTFDRGDGTRVRRSIAVPALRSAVVDVGAIVGMEAADVSTTIESDRLLGIQRSMTWGASPTAIYGSHAETATPSTSPTWFLAEGSTVLGFDLFYLLQNPQATTTHATVRYLLPSGTTITRTYDLPPGSRTTIYVNQIAGLDETDVSGDISADAPIVVERALYRSTSGQPFALGTDSLGVPAAATSWFMAEGATGTFFDLYVLIANPGATDATVQAIYAKPDGTTVTQNYTVRAHSRFSVYVDAIPGLESTSVATTLTSTNAVPIVAERAMYWPGGFFDYYEGHTSAGSTATALQWVVAGAESGGAHAAQTFILIANTENRTGVATIDLLPDVTSTAPAPPPSQVVLNLPPNSRTTVPVTVAGAYGALVTSAGVSPVQLVVESAVYRSDGGVTWSAGSNALATPVP